MKAKPILSLVAPAVCTETVEALELMLTRAKKGDLIGWAGAAMFKNSVFTVNFTGEARRNPTFTRGMLLSLDDLLSEGIEQAAHSAPSV